MWEESTNMLTITTAYLSTMKARFSIISLAVEFIPHCSRLLTNQ